MLIAYLDEIGEPGAYVSKDHPRFNTSPAFGYAGFVIPEQHVREFGKSFTEEKRRLFRTQIPSDQSPGRWERKGSEIFTPDAWSKYSGQVRVFRGLLTTLTKMGGKVFYYAEQKQVGTDKQIRLNRSAKEQKALEHTVNRLCRHAHERNENLLIMMDQINEVQRSAQVAATYAHIFSRSSDYQEMEVVLEPPMHIDSKLSSNIQFADWIAAAISRAIDYQLEPASRYDWVPDAFSKHVTHKFTTESKLHLWQSALEDIHHEQLFRKDRPALDLGAATHLDDSNINHLKIMKHAAERARQRQREAATTD